MRTRIRRARTAGVGKSPSYCLDCGRPFRPAQACLAGLGRERVTPELAAACALARASWPYATAARVLRQLSGTQVCAEEVRRLSVQAGNREVEAQQAEAARLLQPTAADVRADREVERRTQRCACYQERYGHVPRWVERGMGERSGRVDELEPRGRVLLGIVGAQGLLRLEFKPAYSVDDLFTQHLDKLEREVAEEGGAQHMLADHFARVYKVALPWTAVKGKSHDASAVGTAQRARRLAPYLLSG